MEELKESVDQEDLLVERDVEAPVMEEYVEPVYIGTIEEK